MVNTRESVQDASYYETAEVVFTLSPKGTKSRKEIAPCSFVIDTLFAS
ncbi:MULTISPECIES: hypothetical protein [unclassified Vibrio]|nr:MULTISPECIES: hypothetical protein [unclassified Vibrio]